MRCNFTSDFVPQPKIITAIFPQNDGFKIKNYLFSDKVDCLRTEFQMLYNQKYTHVMNMPGDFNQILCTARQYNIICVDRRLVRHVADFCSRAAIEQ